MALTDENNMIMPVAPMNGGFGGGFGNNGDGWWILLLFLLIGNNGWGNGFGGNDGGLYPWMNQADITTSGFQNLSTQNQLTGIQSDLGDIQTQLCNGFSGVNATVNTGFAQAEISDNARQMASMSQMFDIQSALQNCCCENRANIADLKYTVATENCADRAAISDALRNVIESNTANTQRILDQLCQDKIDSKNEEIANLRSELLYARGQASQDVQTAVIQSGQRNLANEIEQYILPTPKPAYVVQNPNCCPQNVGCGCGSF